METLVTKEINLLYTHWNTNFPSKYVREPIPNGSEFATQTGVFNDFSGFINSHLMHADRRDVDNRNIKINKVDLNQYNSTV